MNVINEPSALGFDVQTETFAVPSGFLVTVRETNGQDDAILSNLKENKDQKALNNYLAGIVIDLNGNEEVKPNDILKLRIRDKYYILFRVRILSLGDNIHWLQEFDDGESEYFDEDLKRFDWDYSEGAPALKGQEGYNPHVAAPYLSKEPHVQFELSSGHKVQFDYMTGIEEKSVLGVDENTLDINFRLTTRNFKVFLDKDDEHGSFVENFKMFPSRIMAEIRARLETYDPEWSLSTDVKNPKTGVVSSIPLFGVPDFFYPGV